MASAIVVPSYVFGEELIDISDEVISIVELTEAGQNCLHSCDSLPSSQKLERVSHKMTKPLPLKWLCLSVVDM
jgi:hypothetical protein